jgi:hypothetical protein
MSEQYVQRVVPAGGGSAVVLDEARRLHRRAEGLVADVARREAAVAERERNLAVAAVAEARRQLPALVDAEVKRQVAAAEGQARQILEQARATLADADAKLARVAEVERQQLAVLAQARGQSLPSTTHYPAGAPPPASEAARGKPRQELRDLIKSRLAAGESGRSGR